MSPSVFHLATPSEWDAAQTCGSVAPASLATEGFIHCSITEQLAATIDRHFLDVDQLVLLRLDVEGLDAALIWEEGRPGEIFPHVYRAIELAEVLEVVPWTRGETDLPG